MNHRRVPVSSPRLGRAERSYVIRALRDGWISSRGPYVEEFETRFAKRVGSAIGVSTTSGTSALHLALAALGVGPGDEVVIPDFTMIACVNAVIYTGAKPVFVDVNPQTWTMEAKHVEPKLTERTAAIMPVHIYGHPADMAPLLRLARNHGIPVIEDAAEAHGSLYRGHTVGSIGDVGCFSFYSNKLMTTGEGGMLVTRSRKIEKSARSLRDLCFARSTRDYHHSRLGFNYRMTNLQAAVGLAQLERLDSSIRHHRDCANLYSEVLSELPGIVLPEEASWARSVFWMYTIRVKGGGARRRRLMRELASRGIETRVGFWPLHSQPFCATFVSDQESFPVSDRLGTETLSLPSGNGISRSDVHYVARSLKDILKS